MEVCVDVVVPTVGRPSLTRLLEALDRAWDDRATAGPAPLRPGRVVLVDDRRRRAGGGPRDPAPLPLGRLRSGLTGRLTVVRGHAAGPAAARNAGWRATTAEWVAFLDDDVLPPPEWMRALAADLAGLGSEVAGSQGRVRVPLPAERRPTDWERNVAGLERAQWATADMAYRRAALESVGGFDERFPRAYREDADLALRVQARGWRLVRGERWITHPVRPADRWVSLRLQAGNADDALMLALHGPDWRDRAGAPPGRKRRHLAVTALAAGTLAAVAARRPGVAALAGSAWAAGTAELAWARVAPGPRTPDEVATMLLTSAALPPVAAAWTAIGAVRWRRLLLSRALGRKPDPALAPAPGPSPEIACCGAERWRSATARAAADPGARASAGG